MDFTNAVKILELNIGKDKFLSLPEIEKQYRKLVKIYHPDLYVNDKKKYKWAQEKMKVINDAIEFIRNNYEDIKIKHEIKNAEEYEKAAAMRRAQKNEERKMREQEEAIRKEKFKYEEEIRRKEQKKKEEDRIKKEKLMEERRIKKEKRKEFIKKYKWLIMLFILLAIGIPTYLYGNRNATEYDKTNGIKEVGKYKNFKRDGLWTIYYEDGSYEERYYKYGTLDREIIKYNINGVIIKKITVIDGKKEGKCIEYDSNGNIVFECFYKDDELDGTFKRYSNNKVILEENYKNGILDGKFTLFSNSGKIIIDGFYKDGKREGEWSYNNLQELLKMKDLEYIFSNEYEYLFLLIQKDIALTENNTLYEFIEMNGNFDIFNIKGSFKNGLKEGEWEFYTYKNDDDTGYILISKVEQDKIILYKDDKLVRLLLKKYSYVEEGEKFKSEIFYEDGKMRKKLYQNNYLFLEGDDFDNNKSGKITEFYKSGKISTIIDWKESIEEIGYGNEAYRLRRIVGKAKKFYENGKLFGEGEVRDYPLEIGIAQIDFAMNKKWKYYNQNGKLILEGEYKIVREGDAVYEACYRIGEWNYYYDNGMIRAKGYYSGTGNNKYNSYWEFFDTDGNLEKKIEVEELDDGVGYTIKYYEDGYIINEENLSYIYSNKHADDPNYRIITDLLHVEGSYNGYYQISDKIKLLDEKDIKKQLEE